MPSFFVPASARRQGLVGRGVLLIMFVLVSLATASCDETTRQESDLRVVELIGRDGGTITSHDGVLTVTVPAEATAFSTWFVVEPAHLVPDGNVVPAYEISPSDRTFTAPLSIAIRYGDLVPAGTDPASLRVAVAVGGRWRALARPRLHTDVATVTVDTTHLSTWSLIVATCTEDADCALGETCGGAVCATAACTSDADCAAGVCAGGLCGPPPPCSASTDCPTGEVCVAGSCAAAPECTRSSDCPSGAFCVQGACQHFGCTGDDACAAGEVCIDDTCVPGPACTTDDDCAAGEVCTDGTCEQDTVECTMDVDCEAGETCVDGSCEPPTTPDCTADTDCADDEVCDAGTCTAITCMSGESICERACVSTDSDAANCGGCGVACGAGVACVDGACDITCPGAGETVCGASCVDLMTDGQNCGGCGQDCGSGSCNVGQCECTASDILCNGGCFEPQTSDEHCGLCDNACPTNGSCQSGTCVCDDPALTNCAGSCVNLMTNESYCGACTVSCDVDNNEVCESGSCVTSTACAADTDCATGEVCDAFAGSCTCAAGATRCDGTCVNVQTDTAHCGACNNACAAGQTCDAGTCTSPGCTLDTDCGANETCNTGTGACECTAPFTDCSGACVDTDTDTDHCGTCDNACTALQSCDSGSCADPIECLLDAECGTNEVCDTLAGNCVCDTGYTDCSGTCVTLVTDDTNCGACGTSCGAGQTCAQSSCGATCATNMECGGSNQCIDGGCWPNQITCANAADCPATWTCNLMNRCVAP